MEKVQSHFVVFSTQAALCMTQKNSCSDLFECSCMQRRHIVTQRNAVYRE